MRPARFADHLLNLIRADPQPTDARAFAQCGYTACPYGVVLALPTGARVYLQGVATSWPEQVVHGAPPPPMTMPLLPARPGLTPMVMVERYLGALLTGDQNTELAELELYADRLRPGSVPYGMNLAFHNGARIYLYARHCLPCGRQLGERDMPFRRVDHV